MDKEKVIKEFEHLLNAAKGNYQDFVDLTVDGGEEILTLLKQQEPVAPRYNARTNWYECGNCRFSMTSGMHCRGTLIPAYKVGFCAKCGREQKWE